MMLWRVTVPVLLQAISNESSTANDSILPDTLDRLHQSIMIRLCIGAGTHENTERTQMILAKPVNGMHPTYVNPGEEIAVMQCLTERERQVLNGVARALSNRSIAKELQITEATVKRHLRNIFAKLGAVSRIDAINKANIGRVEELRSDRQKEYIGLNAKSCLYSSVRDSILAEG
jgi:two-component system, NarL family, nitrate/nitrite response regulator NarL